MITKWEASTFFFIKSLTTNSLKPRIRLPVVHLRLSRVFFFRIFKTTVTPVCLIKAIGGLCKQWNGRKTFFLNLVARESMDQAQAPPLGFKHHVKIHLKRITRELHWHLLLNEFRLPQLISVIKVNVQSSCKKCKRFYDTTFVTLCGFVDLYFNKT